MIRQTAKTEIQTEMADNLDDMYEGLGRQIPEGHDLVGIQVSKGTGQTRSAEVREITVNSRAELDTAIPEGWQALSIRQAD